MAGGHHRRPAGRAPHVPAAASVKADALVVDTALYDEAAADDQGFWARQAAELLDWAEDWDTDLRLAAAVRQVVRRRSAQRRPQLPRPPRRRRSRRQGRHPLRGRAGRHPRRHLRRAARRGAALRQRAEGSRRRGRRPGQHLPADDPRGGRGDAGLRPHRRRPQRRVRRLLGAGPGRPHQRRRGQGADHRRRRLAAGRGVPAQAGRRRGGGGDDARIEHVVVVRRGENDVEMVEGRDHWYHDAGRGRRPDLPGRAVRQRAPAVPALHVGHDRQAQGHHAHDRAATSTQVAFTHKYVFDLHPETDVYWCTADVGWVTGPQLHRLRAAGQRRHAS